METFFMYFRRLFHYLFITAFSLSGVANAMQSLRLPARTTSVTHRSMAASVAIRNMKSSASKSNTHLKNTIFFGSHDRQSKKNYYHPYNSFSSFSKNTSQISAENFGLSWRIKAAALLGLGLGLAWFLSDSDNDEKVEQTQTTYSTMNLFWINKKLDENQRYIYPSKDEQALFNDFLKNIFMWAEGLDKNIPVHVWFDSQLTPKAAVVNTQALIDKYMKFRAQKAPIILQDIRDLPEVIQHPEVFSDKTPVYFRVDLLRVIAAYNTITTHNTSNFVYADLDMEPLPQKDLFDDETKQNLKQYGMILAKAHGMKYENGFFILSRHNNNMLEAVKFALIDLNIQRAYNALNDDFYNPSNRRDRTAMKPLQQIVYDSYGNMFKYFFHLSGEGVVKVYDNSTGNWSLVPYDKEANGLKPFGLKHLKYLEFEGKSSRVLGERWAPRGPTKKVKLPPAEHKYDV